MNSLLMEADSIITIQLHAQTVSGDEDCLRLGGF